MNSLKAFHTKGTLEAGCDEAGRGCLAGPVFAAAVILSADTEIEGLDDSKKLKHAKRSELRKTIEDKALAYAVASLSADEIDKLNILNASLEAMHRALDKLSISPELILVDGNKFKPFKDIPFYCLVKGDAIYRSIAAASILAKTCRDDYMEKLHLEYPEYKWNSNKGYPTPAHRRAITLYGATKHHRRTFRLTNEQTEISF